MKRQNESELCLPDLHAIRGRVLRLLWQTRPTPVLPCRSRTFCGMSPCIAETVKLLVRIFSVNQSTCRR